MKYIENLKSIFENLKDSWQEWRKPKGELVGWNDIDKVKQQLRTLVDVYCDLQKDYLWVKTQFKKAVKAREKVWNFPEKLSPKPGQKVIVRLKKDDVCMHAVASYDRKKYVAAGICANKDVTEFVVCWMKIPA